MERGQKMNKQQFTEMMVNATVQGQIQSLVEELRKDDSNRLGIINENNEIIYDLDFTETALVETILTSYAWPDGE